jgi:hypothetical protein
MQSRGSSSSKRLSRWTRSVAIGFKPHPSPTTRQLATGSRRKKKEPSRCFPAQRCREDANAARIGRCCIRVPPRSNFADYRAVLGAYVDDPSFVDVGSIDVEATGTLLAKIEIKATRGQTVSMSNRQGEEASNDPSRFWLCVVPLDSDEEIDELTPERVEGLARFVAGIGSRLTSAREGYDAIGPLRRLAHERGVPIILVHHTRKMDADDIFDTVSGSHGLTGAADTILVLQRQGSGVTLHAVGRDIDQSLRNG